MKRTANTENPADSLRVDIPKDEVPYESRRLEGIKYLDTGKPEWIEMKPILGVVNDALIAGGLMYYGYREESRTMSNFLWRRRGKIWMEAHRSCRKECSLVTQSNQGD